jgi:hypothetical protein
MIGTALILGFFSAIGFWTGGKVTKFIDAPPAPPPAIIQLEEKKEK